MKKSSLLAVTAAALFIAAMPARAQGGCLNSPENPTLVLALVGSASALAASACNRFKRHQK